MTLTPRGVSSIPRGTLPVSHQTPAPSYPHHIPVSLNLHFSRNPASSLNGAEHVDITLVMYNGEPHLFPGLSGKSWLVCIPPGAHERKSPGRRWMARFSPECSWECVSARAVLQSSMPTLHRSLQYATCTLSMSCLLYTVVTLHIRGNGRHIAIVGI